MKFLNHPQPEIDDVERRRLQVASDFHNLRQILFKLGRNKMHPGGRRRLSDYAIAYLRQVEKNTRYYQNPPSYALPRAPWGAAHAASQPSLYPFTTETTREILKASGDLLMLLSLLDQHSLDLITKVGTLVKEISSTIYKEEAR